MISIIDDDKYVLRGFQILLKSSGLESSIFNSVEDFLGSWEPNDSDLLIADMHMPGMNGCNLLEFLKKKAYHPDVIIVTAYDEQVSRDCSLDYGVLAFLIKPVDSDLLLDVVKIWTNKILNTQIT
jgi:FixJ family two-component response regulator